MKESHNAVLLRKWYGARNAGDELAVSVAEVYRILQGDYRDEETELEALENLEAALDLYCMTTNWNEPVQGRTPKPSF